MRGDLAEDAALKLLKRHGLRPLMRNFRCRGGELDLVMLDGEVLVVIEVRARTHGAWGGATESIDARKQQRIVHATQLFVAARPEHARRAIRFDVVLFEGDAAPQWIAAAFDGF
ncbi:YraN family protein [Sinimarinibacterium sp. CAU 1509]|uniref:YraN family protein n=1 Tax=Sinimarinibacterium sp. CAU 1509 TaxID=2562283 RepID=UPI0010ACD965|nr:YraN family protein [Sinimarinibacterium sp. CAU 1509]TJY63332.1 YraN family protein [Sinimarinibacterium sp. CAU 1509]